MQANPIIEYQAKHRAITRIQILKSISMVQWMKLCVVGASLGICAETLGEAILRTLQ